MMTLLRKDTNQSLTFQTYEINVRSKNDVLMRPLERRGDFNDHVQIKPDTLNVVVGLSEAIDEVTNSRDTYTVPSGGPERIRAVLQFLEKSRDKVFFVQTGHYYGSYPEMCLSNWQSTGTALKGLRIMIELVQVKRASAVTADGSRFASRARGLTSKKDLGNCSCPETDAAQKTSAEAAISEAIKAGLRTSGENFGRLLKVEMP